jgi:hypothetical protein
MCAVPPDPSFGTERRATSAGRKNHPLRLATTFDLLKLKKKGILGDGSAALGAVAEGSAAAD